MLRGMGFRSTTPIYLAAGKIYKGEESMEPLRRMFPYLQTKETLLTPEEYARFKVNLILHLTSSSLEASEMYCLSLKNAKLDVARIY